MVKSKYKGNVKTMDPIGQKVKVGKTFVTTNIIHRVKIRYCTSRNTQNESIDETPVLYSNS